MVKKNIYRKHGVEYRISREGGVYIIPLITVFFLFLIFFNLLRKIMQPLFFFYQRNLTKIVSVRLSASVEIFFVSCMRDFFLSDPVTTIYLLGKDMYILFKY